MRIVTKQITTEIKLPDPEDAILTITDSGPGSDPPHQKNLVLSSSQDPSFQVNVTMEVDEPTKEYLSQLITMLCGVAEQVKDAELDAASAAVAASTVVKP